MGDLLIYNIAMAKITKHCNGCNKDLPATTEYFGVKKQKRDGLTHQCRKCIRIYRNNYRAEHPEVRERENRRSRVYFRVLREEAINTYGKICQCCGESNYEFLCIDHIHGSGNKHRKVVGHGGRFYKWLRDRVWPTGYRVLCHNCNMSLGLYGYCPHFSSSSNLKS